MKSEDAKVDISAWRVSAPSDCRYWLSVEDEHFLFGAVKPGDAMLLMDETGDFAWGVRRVFLVRRVSEGSIVYFDRECDFSVMRKRSVYGMDWSIRTTRTATATIPDLQRTQRQLRGYVRQI